MKQTILTPLLVVSLLFGLVLISACANSGDDGGAENPALAKKIETYLTDFGMPGTETSWYKNIIGISVRGNTVQVKTNLSSNDRKAGDICGRFPVTFSQTRIVLTVSTPCKCSVKADKYLSIEAASAGGAIKFGAT